MGRRCGPQTGRWSAHTALREGDDGWHFGGQLDVPRGPLEAGPSGGIPAARDRIDVAEIAPSSPYAALEASGQLSDLYGARRVDLLGRLTPDWQAINGLLSQRVEPRGRRGGASVPVRLQGSLTGGGLGRSKASSAST